jgi:hypothetical protein
MNWEDYRQAYRDFDTGVVRSRFLGATTVHGLEDFPKNLPYSVRVGVQAALDSMAAMAKEILATSTELTVGEAEPPRADVIPIRPDVLRAVEPINDESLREAALDLYLLILGQGQRVRGVDFDGLLRCQELVMLLRGSRRF